MGLSLLAARQVDQVPDNAITWSKTGEPTNFPEHSLRKAYVIDQGFMHGLAGLGRPHREYGMYTTGWVACEDLRDGPAWSHLEYRFFRRALSLTFMGVEPETVWAAPEEHQDSPFFEIVNFAENEGVLGPQACLALLEDFRRVESDQPTLDRFAALASPSGHDDERAAMQAYRLLHRAVEHAAGRGALFLG